jgi:hypothetical protein
MRHHKLTERGTAPKKRVIVMKVEIAMPEMGPLEDQFRHFWIRHIFVGSVSDNYAVTGMAANYVRLVEASIVEYRLAREQLTRFWSTHDGIAWGAMNRAISHFEACLNDMQRAIRAFNQMRSHSACPPALRQQIALRRPLFGTDTVSGQIRKLRDAVQHTEERLRNGKLQAGDHYMLSATGPETPMLDEPGQTLKVIDRIELQCHALMFKDIALWLDEMAQFAAVIADHTGTTSPHGGVGR